MSDVLHGLWWLGTAAAAIGVVGLIAGVMREGEVRERSLQVGMILLVAGTALRWLTAETPIQIWQIGLLVLGAIAALWSAGRLVSYWSARPRSAGDGAKGA